MVQLKKFISLLVILYVFFVLVRVVSLSKPLKISVIVPVYNVENYLRECMDSIINQSFENLEIICVNDGSTDNSLKILNEYAEKDSRVKIVTQENKGVSSARNKGMELSTGEYVSFIDPDDYLEKDAFKIASSNLENGNIDILIWGYNPFPNPTSWYIKASSPDNAIYKNDSVNAYFNGHGSSVVVWNKLYKTDMIRKKSLSFNEKLNTAEDVEFNMMAFVHASNIKFISDKLYYYRLKREGSLTSSANGEMRAKNNKMLFENVFGNWDKLNFLKGNESKLLKYFINISFNTLDKIIEKQKKVKYAREFLDIFWRYTNESDVVQRLPQVEKGRLVNIQKLSNEIK